MVLLLLLLLLLHGAHEVLEAVICHRGALSLMCGQPVCLLTIFAYWQDESEGEYEGRPFGGLGEGRTFLSIFRHHICFLRTAVEC